MSKVIVITGAGSGFGALSARRLASAGYTVYAGIRETTGRNADRVEDAKDYADQNGVDLRTVELDISSQESCEGGIARIIEESGRLDVVLHNAGHMVLGPLEAYTPEELTHVYDVNVLGTQRINRAALPHLRRPPTPAGPGRGPASLGRQHQHAGRHPALPRPLLRRQGRDGLPRRQLRR